MDELLFIRGALSVVIHNSTGDTQDLAILVDRLAEHIAAIEAKVEVACQVQVPGVPAWM